MNEIAVGIVIIIFLFGWLLTGIELAFGMTIVGFIGFAYLVSFPAAMNLLAKDFYDTVTSFGLTVIPLFVLMGQIAFNTGMATRLYRTAHKFMGHIPGGLAVATIVGAALFKAICGSSSATTATFASVSVPEMERYGYNRRLSTGSVAIVGTLGVLIPPSVIIIVFGIVTQQSITRLFLAALVPALMLAILYVGVIIVWCKINPSLGPVAEKASLKERIGSVPDALWPGVVFVVMVGGLMLGVFTPTEAGSVGTLGVLFLCLMKRDLTFKTFIGSIRESLRVACMVIMLIVGSTILGHCLTVTTLPSMAANWVVNLAIHRALIMVTILVIYQIGGSFIDDLAFMILATPIFYPAIIKLGYDPLWIGVIICV
ncbi:MAG: TRAP transporter large permease, partial [Alphaproteobacteria bacterium]